MRLTDNRREYYRNLPKEQVKTLAQYWGYIYSLGNKHEIRITGETLDQLFEVKQAIDEIYPELSEYFN